MAKKPAEKKTKKTATKSSKKTAKKAVADVEATETDVDEESEEEEAPKKKGKKGKKAKKAAEDSGKKAEGLTKATEADGVIRFKEGSGSQDILNLIVKYGYNREKVVAAAEKLKEKGSAFLKSDPAKKYTKVATIVKSLEANGFKLPTAAEKPAKAAKKKKAKAKSE